MINVTYPEPYSINTLASTVITSTVIRAVIVGLLGSIAYFSAIVFGFITNEAMLAKIYVYPKPKETQKENEYLVALLEKAQKQDLTHMNEISWARLIWFVSMGGIVAGVFQLPQLDNFAPIQAFVLGTTWPSIITQIMGSEAMGKIKKQEEKDQEIANEISNVLKRI